MEATHALFRDTKHLRLSGRVCFYRRLLSDAVRPRGCLSWLLWPLRGINKTAWGAKLILTADLAYPVSCASLGHLLMAKHYPLSLNVCFNPPTAHIGDITAVEKTTSKTRGIQIACRISYEIIISYITRLSTLLESHNAFNSSNWYFSRYYKCVNTVSFPKSGHYEDTC